MKATKTMFGLLVGSSVLMLATQGCSGTVGTRTGPDGKTEATGKTSSALAGSDALSQIAVQFETGGDDKRSDSQVWFHVTVNGFDQQCTTDGTGNTWQNWTWTQWFFCNLPAGTHNQDISNFWVSWAQGGGGFIQTGDNWNMESVNIWAWDDNSCTATDGNGNCTQFGAWQFKGQPGGNPLQRFKGDVTTWSWGGWPL
jgi:hypothetical protein